MLVFARVARVANIRISEKTLYRNSGHEYDVAGDLPGSEVLCHWRLASRYFEPCHVGDKGSRSKVLND
jgi:hypothetical protein